MEPIKQCILIDDDADDQSFFSMALEDIDVKIDCRTANSGVEALQLFKEEQSYVPDYIFLDVNMPRMNGLECLRELSKLDHLKKSRVVMYSTSLEDHIIETGRSLGASDFIVKPAGISALTESLSTIFKGKDPA